MTTRPFISKDDRQTKTRLEPFRGSDYFVNQEESDEDFERLYEV